MIKAKIKTLSSLAKIIAKHKKAKQKIVFTNGCFDIMHRGHVNYLQTAKKKGDILVVGLNSDASIRKIKGKFRPINCQLDRSEVIAALASVDYVTIFTQETPLELIKTIKPDILVKGADWKTSDIVGADVLKQYGGKIAREKFLNGYSTTKLIEKIAKTKL
ncbi:MAG: D-glycero-beta-D-manno-heptose 1-phosphate adenylyltransferase [Candidatus Omnitrophica bacterium]|nr:D-glycero-beta-D-manno-heptose 1-phosphate adenylyltransferase [Candidatus Omnitrophota bacterium]